VNAHYLHKTRSESQQWKQPQPETVIENVEWNMEEEEDVDRRSGGMHHGEPFGAGGQSKNSGGPSGNVGGQSQSIGGRSEKIDGQSGGQLGTGEGSGIWGTGKGLESQFSSSPSWMDYSNVTEGQAEGYHVSKSQTNRGQTETNPQNPLSNPDQAPPSLRDSIGDGLRSSVVSGVSSAAEDSPGGGTKDGKRKRRRNRGKGRKKALSESSAAAEAGENDSAASDSSSMRGLQSSVRGGILAKGAGGGSQRVGNKIDVHHLAKQGGQKAGSGGKGVTESQQGGSALLQKAADVTPSSSLILQRAEKESRGVSKSEGGSKLQKGGSSHQNDGSSDQSSVNASVSEPREQRLSGDRWQHVVRKVESEEGAQGEDEEGKRRIRSFRVKLNPKLNPKTLKRSISS
jgi:hypothetical protein